MAVSFKNQVVTILIGKTASLMSLSELIRPCLAEREEIAVVYNTLMFSFGGT